MNCKVVVIRVVSTHSRAEAAANDVNSAVSEEAVSTHSRAEAAATKQSCTNHFCASFNTQPRGGGCLQFDRNLTSVNGFQHTAARRRLQLEEANKRIQELVSTHSRAEAAACL